jgi:multicomponent Na+:H+ antiporter subunit C
MSTDQLYLMTGALLFVLGMVYVVNNPKLLGKILAVNIAGSGVFLVLITIAYRNRLDYPDPVPQAMVLTGIVVAVSATALALAAAARVERNRASNSHSDEPIDK